MKIRIRTLLFACMLGLLLDVEAHAATGCDEWADFAKIITYRFRDHNIPKDAVKAELARVKGGDPEMSIAQGLVDYSYAHPEKDATAIWHGSYEQCLKENTL